MSWLCALEAPSDSFAGKESDTPRCEQSRAKKNIICMPPLAAFVYKRHSVIPLPPSPSFPSVVLTNSVTMLLAPPPLSNPTHHTLVNNFRLEELKINSLLMSD
jgi:hypothetical protein